MCDVAWRIHGPAKNETCFVLFPGKDNTVCSSTSNNPDTSKTSYFISQSLPYLDTIAESRVHLFSYYVCPENHHIYWLYRGIYTLVKEFKSTLSIDQSTSSLNGTKLSISGNIPVYLSLWSRAIEWCSNDRSTVEVQRCTSITLFNVHFEKLAWTLMDVHQQGWYQ